MAEARELILKLGQKITDRIGVKVTTEDPEYCCAGDEGEGARHGPVDSEAVQEERGAYRRAASGNERHRPD